MKTRDRIISAAIPAFAARGRHGTHMEEVAKNAHINKAMIYYIFHSKDELYFEVLKFVLEQTWRSIDPIKTEFRDRKEFREILSLFISSQIEFFFNNRDYTKILVDAMSSGSEEIARAVTSLKNDYKEYNGTDNLKTFIENGKNAKAIRSVDTDQLMISIIGMVLIYFLSPSINISLDIDVEDENRFLLTRRESIIDLVINGIMTNTKKANT